MTSEKNRRNNNRLVIILVMVTVSLHPHQHSILRVRIQTVGERLKAATVIPTETLNEYDLNEDHTIILI